MDVTYKFGALGGCPATGRTQQWEVTVEGGGLETPVTLRQASDKILESDVVQELYTVMLAEALGATVTTKGESGGVLTTASHNGQQARHVR